MLIHPDFDPVAISIGPIDVHWYGIMYLLGFAGGWWVAMHRIKTTDAVISKAQLESLVTYVAFGVILGGRVGSVLFYHLEDFLSDPLMLIRVWEGGMSFHGGLVGVIIALVIYAWRTERSLLALGDFVAPTVPLGLGFGRLGNFIGQELWGRASDVPWAMVFPNDPSGLARHPSQLYQAALEGGVLFAAVFWFSRKPRPRGAVCGLFLLLYGAFRIFSEFFREPDAHIAFDLFGWVTRGMWLSLPLVLAGAGLMFFAYYRRRAQQGG
ncbi:prolipoprotein diacylglyceryl transferase [Marinimicrobium alkaliphilum]|uniref:prolipoprotein diacylglyceryl transferase n=1 Tax=Marinimicrobium alkaliphilum TaxID=2202654 RepID=UPI000DB9787E|nr:prolipoprotein diacylglyceryl transferase [Marinimicrobium alkaliphilum]